jgi:uncharacterized membrane protein YhaH (DUF805 family)
MNMMFEPLRKYAQFSGRARRSEFWLFALLMFIVQVVANLLLSVAGGRGALAAGQMPAGPAMIVALLVLVVMLGFLVPSIAVTFRRLHDTNRSAWWLLIALIPFVGALVLLVFYVLPGTPGPNRFGPDPKGDTAEVFA